MRKRQSWLKRNAWLVLFGIGLLALVTLIGQMDEAAEVAERDHYCEMVKLHMQTKGEHGWPDYRSIYRTECR